jgi:DNA-binding response OmpR family regulator
MESTTVKIKCVSTTDEVLTVLRDEPFDVILVDRQLGGWLSAQACKALRARAGHIPVVG